MRIALYYDDSGYKEQLTASARPTSGGPKGLMGRQVAGKEFLEAYLMHASENEAVALVRNRSQGNSLIQTCQAHPATKVRNRRWQIIEERELRSRFQNDSPASILYFPCPLDARYAWMRQHLGSDTFSLCGVTHTLSSLPPVRQLCEMVTAPFEHHDALICTSQAVVDMVKEVTSTYASYLKERMGGDPQLRVRLEKIPLGVDPQKFRPPSSQEKDHWRGALDIKEDEIAVLFVGRLSHHGKAHPYPLYRGVSEAVKQTGRKAHLILSGWAAHPAVQSAFEEGARELAPNVRVTFVDGTDPAKRFGVWHAADIFASFSDNIQETFGLVIVEAMACGLPVVASDWNGYRDLVVQGKTGFLASTVMVSGATTDSTTRLLFGEINYDHYLAEVSQSTTVDLGTTVAAFVRLFEDEALRAQMGKEGRARALSELTWAAVVRRYERLWAELHRHRQSVEPTLGSTLGCYPPPERTFSKYPTRLLDGTAMLKSHSDSLERLQLILRLPLTNHVDYSRITDVSTLSLIVQSAEHQIGLAELVGQFNQIEPQRILATIGWLLKYQIVNVIGME